jgi:hypothetical protein
MFGATTFEFRTLCASMLRYAGDSFPGKDYKFVSPRTKAFSYPQDVIRHPPSRLCTNTAMSQYRLPDDVRPTHYNLTVRTDLESYLPHFEGIVKIECVSSSTMHLGCKTDDMS